MVQIVRMLDRVFVSDTSFSDNVTRRMVVSPAPVVKKLITEKGQGTNIVRYRCNDFYGSGTLLIALAPGCINVITGDPPCIVRGEPSDDIGYVSCFPHPAQRRDCSNVGCSMRIIP